MIVVMDHDVTSDLSGVESIPPDFQQTHRLHGYNMEYEDVEGVIPYVSQELGNQSSGCVNESGEMLGNDEAGDSCERKGGQIA